MDRCGTCGGRLDPTTDGMGNVIDYCARCENAPRLLRILPSKSPTMPTFDPKPCAKCGTEFTPTGPASKFCSDECKPTGTASAPKKKAKAEPPEKKRKVIRTGYVPETPRNAGGKYGLLVDDLRAELDELTTRREQIEAAITAIEKLDEAA
jgi:hypothetical protein